MKKHRLIRLVFMFALAGNADLFAAEPLSYQRAGTRPDSSVVAINEVVIRENRFKTTFSKINRHIRIMNRELIDALPVRTLNELLSHATGVDLRQRGPFGAQADISIDGGTFEQTLILVNGVKMLDAQTAHHGLNLPIPLDAIERIEIIRGPAARIYGVNSLTGAINVVTRRPKENGVRVRSSLGSSFQKEEAHPEQPMYYVYDVEATGDLVTDRQSQHTLSLQHASGNGHRYNTAIQQYRVFYQGKVPMRDSSAITVMGGWIHNDFGANGYYAAPGDRESQEIVRTAFGVLSYTKQLHPRLLITPLISYRSTQDDYRYDRHDLSRARSEHQGYSLSPELHATWQLPTGEIGLGAEWRREHINSSNIGIHDRNNYGGYAEYRTQYQDWLTLNAGMYVNYHSDYGWQWFPGIDLGLRITDRLRWTAHSGTGQRIPSFTDLYLDQRPGNIGNPQVMPERAWQLASGFKYSGRQIYMQANYFYRNINQFIDWVHPQGATPPYQPMNFDHNRIHGWSASADSWFNVRPGVDRWRTSLQYTVLHPTYTHSVAAMYVSKYSLEILRQQLTGHIFYERHGWSAGIAGRWQERTNDQAYLLGDVRLGHAWERFELQLDVQNVFDVSYKEAGAIPLPGRWYSLGIKFLN